MRRPSTAAVLQGTAVVVAAAVAIGLGLSGGGTSGATSLQYTTQRAAVTTMTDAISGSGSVQPDTTLSLSFGSSSNVVTSVSVRVGEAVKAGQVLGTVDPTSADKALATAQAQYAAAVVASSTPVTSATTCTNGGGSGPTPSARPSQTPSGRPSPSARPTPTGTPSGSPSPTGSANPIPTHAPTPSHSAAARPTTKSSCAPSSSGSGTRTSFGGSTLTLTQAQSQLASAQAAVAATTLTAPQKGVVLSVDMVKGALPGSPAITMRAAGYQVVVNVAEQDAPYIKVGQVGTATFSALGSTSPAKVIQAPVASTSTSSSGSVAAFSVVFAVTTPPPGLLPGMSASISLTALTKRNVLTVPTAAVQSGDVGYFVRVLRGGQPVAVPVQLGLSTTSLTEITRGLAWHEAVITSVTAK